MEGLVVFNDGIMYKNNQFTTAFRAAIADAGLTPPKTIVPDGKVHRFASNGKKGDDAGWYVYRNSSVMAAIQQGIITPSTKAALQRAEAEHELVKSELQENAQAVEVITAFLPRAAERYKALVAGLGQALYTDILQAKQCLKALMGQIRLPPSAGGYLEAPS